MIREINCVGARLLAMPFYAVRLGRKPGIYNTWPECLKQVENFKYAKYRKFDKKDEAVMFINGFDNPGGSCSTPTKNAPTPTKVVPTPTRSAPYKKAMSASSSATSPYKTAMPTFRSATSPVGSQLSATSTETSPTYSIDYQLKLTDEEINLLKEKLTFLQNKKQLLLKEKALEEKKLGFAKEESKLKSKENHLSKKSVSVCPKSPHDKNTSASWSQNRIAKPLDITEIRKMHTSAVQYDSENGKVVVYTDGSCVNNGKQDPRAGIGVYWGENHPLNISERLQGRQTNNRAEIFAALKAVQQAKMIGLTEIIVKTDSQFLISAMTKWIHGWIKKGWKTSTRQDVINKDDFLALMKEMEGITVHWEHVNGHAGIYGNECADKLAMDGAMKSELSE